MSNQNNIPSKAEEVKLSYNRPAISSMPKISNSYETQKLFRAHWEQPTLDLHESMMAMFLTRSNHVLAVSLVGVGCISSVIINKKAIFQQALLLNACSIILCHNHPSGNLKPSKHDLHLTDNVKQACNLLDIQLLDHIILTSESYTSLSDEGLLT